MNNENRNSFGNNNEDRFSTLDIDGINDLYYENVNSAAPNNNQNNHPQNSTRDLLKIALLLLSIILLIIIIYTAIVGILGSGKQPSSTTSTGIVNTLPTTVPQATTSLTTQVTLQTTTASKPAITTTVQTTTAATTTSSSYNPAYENAVIFIDAGHGGHDVGAIGKVDGMTIYEENVNLTVSLLVREALEKRGFTVVMSRETDVFIELADRPAMAVDADADMFISIHCNSYSDKSVYGPRMYYTARSGLSYSGATFAQYFTNAFDSVRKQYTQMKASRNYTDSSVLGDNKHYAVLCNKNMPSILIEMGFITNESDLRLFLNESWQHDIANSIADAIEKAYNAGMVTKK